MHRAEETMLLSEHERIKKALIDEVLRKDKIIEKLRMENEMLLKTALKRADALQAMQEKLGKATLTLQDKKRKV